MFDGGYQIINLGNNAITAGGSAVTIGNDIYNKIKNCNLPILIKGLKIGSTVYRPCYVNFQAGTNKYVGTVEVVKSTHGLTATILTITNADKASVETVEVAEYSAL